MSPLVVLNDGRSVYRKQAVTPPTDPFRDSEKAFYATIAGSARLVEMQKCGVNITDKEINDGIETNAEKLGIDTDEYREKMRMITDPKPEPNPNPELASETSIETNGPRM